MADVVKRFRLSWESEGHDSVQREADDVDEALDGVAARLDEVTRRTEAGRRPLDQYAGELDKLRKRADDLTKGLTKASSTTETAEERATRVAERNTQRRIQLLDDEDEKRRALLEARQSRELRTAQKSGEDLAVIEAVHAQKRQELEQKLAERAELNAQREARARARAAQEAQAVEFAALEARARALEDSGQRELALLDVKHRREHAAAERAGRDLTLVVEAQAAERARAVEKIGSEAAKAGSSAKAFGEGLTDSGEGARRGAAGLEAFEKRVGVVNKLLTGFGLLSIPAAITGIIDLGKRLWELTDAGKAQAAAAEAQKAALDALVSSLREVSDLTRISTEDLAGYALAHRQMTITEGKFKEALDERVELEAERREAVEAAAKAEKAATDALSVRSRIGAGAYATLRDRADEAQTEIAEINERIAESDRALQRHAEAHRDAQKALRETRRDVQALGEPVKLLTELWDKASEAAKRAADEAKRSADEASRKLRETLQRQLELAEAIRLDDLPSLDIENILGGPRGPILLGEIKDAIDDLVPATGGAADMAEQLAMAYITSGQRLRDDLAATKEAIHEVVAEHAAMARDMLGDVSSTVGLLGQMQGLESSNAIQRARNRERDAKGEKEQLAAKKAVLAAERAAEQERRRFQAIEFALKATENVNAAAEEAAKAAGSYPDPVGIALHTVSAVKHAAAAALYGRGVASAVSAPSAVGGGAGGASAPPPAPSAADRPRSASQGGSTHVTIVQNGIMADGRTVRTAVVDGLNTVGDGQVPIMEGS